MSIAFPDLYRIERDGHAALDLAALRAAARLTPAPRKTPGNPMSRSRVWPAGNRRGDLGQVPRCAARRKRDGGACTQPAMRGRRVCRLHGGKGGAPRGLRNGAWRGGACSQEWALFMRPTENAERAARLAAKHMRAWLRAARAAIAARRKAAAAKAREAAAAQARESRHGVDA